MVDDGHERGGTKTRVDRAALVEDLIDAVSCFTVEIDDALANYGLSRAELAMLRVLATQSHYEGVRGLAKLADRAPSRASLLTRRLAARGLIVRVAQAGDRRCVNVRITARGVVVLRRALAAVVAISEELLSDLGESELEMLVDFATSFFPDHSSEARDARRRRVGDAGRLAKAEGKPPGGGVAPGFADTYAEAVPASPVPSGAPVMVLPSPDDHRLTEQLALLEATEVPALEHRQ